MKKIVGAVAVACLAGALLTGCGGSDNKSSSPNDTTDTSTSTGVDTTAPSTTTPTTSSDDGGGGGASGDYCDDLKSAKVTVQALGAGSLTQASFDKMTGLLHIIATEAPDSVSDDWNTLGDTLNSMSEALQAAGISFDDLSTLGQPGSPTIDPAKLQALTKALQSFSAADLTTATTAIDAEVSKDCGFALGMGG